MPTETCLFDYLCEPKERLETCNLCGMKTPITLAIKDRYGFDVGKVECDCGLIYLSPRMTKEAYAKFYQGPYRALVSAYHGREINAKTIQPEQKLYAEKLGDLLKPFLDRRVFNSLLDVGGSTGVVAACIGKQFKIKATVLDPAAAELKYALKAGCLGILGSIEEFEPTVQKWDLVLLCQTVDHLLDPMGTLKKLKGCLAPEGIFFVDIVDFDVTKEVKIDHPFNLTPKTMKAYLDRAGFKVLQEQRAEDGVHVGYVCEAA